MPKSYRSSQEIMLRHDSKTSGKRIFFGLLNLAAAIAFLLYATLDNAAEDAGAAAKRTLLRGARFAGRTAAVITRRR